MRTKSRIRDYNFQRKNEIKDSTKTIGDGEGFNSRAICSTAINTNCYNTLY